ncbi:MAG: twin transmembrane helix small protein [Gammaproteobacteria bacterium]
MNTLTIVIMIALLTTIGLIGTGIWSMAHGGDFDRRHSTQLMIARVGMQGVTLLLLIVAFYLAH